MRTWILLILVGATFSAIGKGAGEYTSTEEETVQSTGQTGTGEPRGSQGRYSRKTSDEEVKVSTSYGIFYPFYWMYDKMSDAYVAMRDWIYNQFGY